MSDVRGEKLLFGRYTREECGLPPEGWNVRKRRALPLRVAILLVALLIAGWLGGGAMARWREAWVAYLPARVLAAAPEEASPLLNRGRVYAQALPERRRMRRDLAIAAVIEAERSPRRLGYYANAANLLRGDTLNYSGSHLETFNTNIAAAGVFAELKDYENTFAALNHARVSLDLMQSGHHEAARPFRLILANARAYFLAIAGTDEGGNPETALELAELMITSRDTLPGGGYPSGSAAFLDTLATARFAAGDAAGARAAQELALGLADAGGLEVYLEHYDEFSAAASE